MVESVDKNWFTKAPNLRKLSLPGSKLTERTIPADAFSTCPRLESLDFTGNRFRTIEPARWPFIQSVPNLKELHIPHNLVVKGTIPANAFNMSLKSLKFLDISNCLFLEGVEDHAFDSLTALVELRMQFMNRMKVVPKIHGLKNLTVIAMGNSASPSIQAAQASAMLAAWTGFTPWRWMRRSDSGVGKFWFGDHLFDILMSDAKGFFDYFDIPDEFFHEPPKSPLFEVMGFSTLRAETFKNLPSLVGLDLFNSRIWSTACEPVFVNVGKKDSTLDISYSDINAVTESFVTSTRNFTQVLMPLANRKIPDQSYVEAWYNDRRSGYGYDESWEDYPSLYGRCFADVKGVPFDESIDVARFRSDSRSDFYGYDMNAPGHDWTGYSISLDASWIGTRLVRGQVHPDDYISTTLNWLDSSLEQYSQPFAVSTEDWDPYIPDDQQQRHSCPADMCPSCSVGSFNHCNQEKVASFHMRNAFYPMAGQCMCENVG